MPYRSATPPRRHALATVALATSMAAGLGTSATAQIVAPSVPGAAVGAPESSSKPANPVETTEKPYVAPATFGEWASSIKLSLQAEGGVVINAHSPDYHRNFGQLATDNANRPVLNQVLLTLARDVNPKATSTDIGFKLQAMYGSDSRIYQTLGLFDQLIHDRNQIALIEANVAVRFPTVFAGGLDVKAGLYPTPLGTEVIDPKANPFYSHSYIFNYGLPFKHLGALATAHVSDLVDLYFGVDTGTNTSIAYGAGDNNNRPGGIAGVGLNFLDGKLTVLALTHIGPENSRRNTPFANSALRYFNDVAVVWKATDKLTLTAEGNFVKDDGFNAEAWGIAAYGSYALSDEVTVNGRAEVFRDNNNFFVANPVGDRDFANFQRGVFSRFYTATKATTYSEYTLGLTYKPGWTPKALSTAMIRPEIRYDRSLNNTRPFGDGSKGALTAAADIVIGF